jgi:hypothetical protein
MKKSDWTASIPVSIPLGLFPWVVKIGLTAGIPVPFSYLWDLRDFHGYENGRAGIAVPFSYLWDLERFGR